MTDRYLIYRAYFYHLKGVPIPVDLFMDLVEQGINPEDLSAVFEEGECPPFDEDITDFDDTEVFIGVEIDGVQCCILGITQEELDELLEEMED